MKRQLKGIVKTVVTGALALAMTVTTAFSGTKTSLNTVSAATASNISGVSTISGLSSDFIKGVDISEVISIENSGATFEYLDGTSGDIFDILKGAGVNYIRIRVWNNPYDSSSSTNYKGYGGGNCDLYNAKVLGKRATAAGMKVLIDFHYSDFWADPDKQYAPKAWSSYSLAYKKDAVYNWTYSSLKELISYGVDVEMVQIGNETNGSMCGVGGLYDGTWDLSSGVGALMQQGCYAVDDINTLYSKSILKVLHFTDLNANGLWYAECLDNLNIDYDVFATSYYPMWHGTASDLASNLTAIAKTYGKKVMVAETGYPYTFTNSDSEGNNVGSSSSMNYSNYAVSVSGQANAIRDVFAAVQKVNTNVGSGYGLGAFYWSPENIAVSSSTWGTYGSGWASSTSGNYELLYESSVSSYSTTDRGSSWDNMTLFDSNGQAMKSLYVFNDISGATSTTGSGSSSSSSNSSSSSSSSTTINLNANNLTKGTYTSNITSGSFTIGASSSKNVAVKSTSTTVNGTSYSKVLLMNGGGNSSGRYIKFTTTGAATIRITAASTSSSASRTVRVAKSSVGGTKMSDLTVTGTAQQQTVSVSSAGTYYIYSTSCGIYVYDVTVTY